MSDSFSQELTRKQSLSSVLTADLSEKEDPLNEFRFGKGQNKNGSQAQSESNLLLSAPESKSIIQGAEVERSSVHMAAHSNLKSPLTSGKSHNREELMDEKMVEGYEILLGNFYNQLVENKKKNKGPIKKVKILTKPVSSELLMNVPPGGFVPTNMMGKSDFRKTFTDYLDGKCTFDKLMSMKNFPNTTSRFQEAEEKKKHIRRRLTNAITTVKLGNVKDNFTNIVRKGLNSISVEKEFEERTASKKKRVKYLFGKIRKLIEERVKIKRIIREEEGKYNLNMNFKFLGQFYTIAGEYMSKIKNKDLLNDNPEKSFYQKDYETVNKRFKDMSMLNSISRAYFNKENKKGKNPVHEFMEARMEKTQNIKDLYKTYFTTNADFYLKNLENPFKPEVVVPHVISKPKKFLRRIEASSQMNSARESSLDHTYSSKVNTDRECRKSVHLAPLIHSPRHSNLREAKPTGPEDHSIIKKVPSAIKDAGIIKRERSNTNPEVKFKDIDRVLLDNKKKGGKAVEVRNKDYQLKEMHSERRLTCKETRYLDPMTVIVDPQVNPREMRLKNYINYSKDDGLFKTQFCPPENIMYLKELSNLDNFESNHIFKKLKIIEIDQQVNGENMKAPKIDERHTNFFKERNGKIKNYGKDYFTIKRNTNPEINKDLDRKDYSEDDSELPSLTEAALDDLYSQSISIQNKIKSKKHVGFGLRLKQFMRLDGISKSVEITNRFKLKKGIGIATKVSEE